jgi:hypothetical protein
MGPKEAVAAFNSPCGYWRACCCDWADDLHCWGCGFPQDQHTDGERPAHRCRGGV